MGNKNSRASGKEANGAGAAIKDVSLPVHDQQNLGEATEILPDGRLVSRRIQEVPGTTLPGPLVVKEITKEGARVERNLEDIPKATYTLLSNSQQIDPLLATDNWVHARNGELDPIKGDSICERQPIDSAAAYADDLACGEQAAWEEEMDKVSVKKRLAVSANAHD